MRIIDAHVHLYPPEVGRDPVAWAAAQGEPHWAVLCTRRRRGGQPVQTFPPIDQLLRDMDAAGVDKAVLLGWYQSLNQLGTLTSVLTDGLDLLVYADRDPAVPAAWLRPRPRFSPTLCVPGGWPPR